MSLDQMRDPIVYKKMFFPHIHLHNNIKFSANFEQNKFARLFLDIRPDLFCSKLAKTKFLLWKMDTGNKLYFMKFYDL